MRLLLALIVTLLLGACSEQPAAAPVVGPHDPLGAGWTAVIDLGKDPEPGRFVLDAGTLTVGHGRNATLWHPKLRTTGSCRLSAEVTHLDSGLHPHGAGLVFGGSEVDGAGESYTYFLVRCDRQFLIKTRRGTKTADVVAWTEHDAIAPEDDKLVTQNRLAVEITDQVTRFLINDKIVHSAPSLDLPRGDRCGFRLVHDIQVRFGPLQLEPLAR